MSVLSKIMKSYLNGMMKPLISKRNTLHNKLEDPKMKSAAAHIKEGLI
jgi:hypothetical protein